MSISVSNRYWGSEPDPGGGAGDCNKENSLPENLPPAKPSLSRRQRKNRRRDDASPPDKKQSKTKRLETCKKPSNCPLKQFIKLGLDEKRLGDYLRHYLLSPEQMLNLGYPVESDLHLGRAIIFKSVLTAPQSYNPYRIAPGFDVNAREFVPYSSEIKSYDWDEQNDSGRGSSSDSSSSDPAEENEESSSDQQDLSIVKSSGAAVRDDVISEFSEERQCVRCGKGFFVAADGEYLTHEHCTYHWGKLQRCFGNYNTTFACCRGKPGSVGCTTGKLHVWNGLGVGFNGPFDSYARTKPRKSPPPDGNYGIYALDCEMCYTVRGLELTKITVVGGDGRLVYDCFVKPECSIVDYNTRFSGITARDLNSRKATTKTLKDVQNDLMGFINADTILVGHGLENDLRALRLIHSTVVDTAVTFPHYNGLPYRRSLKSLASYFLKRDIQSSWGHNSYEDARAAMELMLWRVRKDFRHLLEQEHHL